MQYNVLPDEEHVFSVLVAFIATVHFKAKKKKKYVRVFKAAVNLL